MKTRNNKGFSKPAILTLSALVIAGLGFGAYSFLGNQNTLDGIDTESLDEETMQMLKEIDLNSKESIAAALYQAVLTENFSGVKPLVDRYRVLEYNEHNPDPDFPMTEEEKIAPINISENLSNAAIEKIEDKIRYIDERLTSKQHQDTYRFYLSSLINIYSFFQSKQDDIIDLEDSVKAYQAYMNNQDYTISDIRALFGTVKSIKVCRFLMGVKDYSRMSPIDMKEYISREISTLIKQIPVGEAKRNGPHSAAEFASLSIPALKDIIELNRTLPSIITNISNIDGVNKSETSHSYQMIKDRYNATVANGINFLNVAQVFFQCQATTSEPFKIGIKPTSNPIEGVAKAGDLTLDAFKIRFSNPLSGCAQLGDGYLLVPNVKQYEALFAKAEKRLSDEEREVYKNDLALIKSIYDKKSLKDVEIHGSDVAAVENHLERNPEQGYFIGKNDQGLLFNLTLKSYQYLQTLDISSDADPIFSKSYRQESKHKQARYKLAIIDDFKKVEDRMANLDFAQLENAPYKYTTGRLVEDKLIKFNYTNQDLLAEIDYSDSLDSSSNEVSNNTDYTVEIATNVYEDDNFSDKSFEITSNSVTENTVATETTTEVVQSETPTEVEDVKPETKTTEVAQTPKEEPKEVALDTKTTEVAKVEEPKPEEKVEEVAKAPEKAPEPQEKPKNFLTAQQLRKARIKEVRSQEEQGNLDATYELAVRYINGQEIRRNVNEGAKLLNKAVLKEHHPSEYLLGSINYNNPKASSKQKEQGATLILKAANAGVVDAYAQASQFYLDGKYTKKDPKKALDLLNMASDKGDHKAQYQLGMLYLNGDKGVTKSTSKAVGLLSAAASHNPNAALTLADIYSGKIQSDVNKNPEKASDLYISAARNKQKDAYKEAGIALLQNKSTMKEGYTYLSEYLKTHKDDKEAGAALFNYYVETNNTKGIAENIVNADDATKAKFPLELGLLYETGNGVKQDYKLAMEYYRKAIAQDKPLAFCYLGNMFEKGLGTKVDLRSANGQYTRGSDAGVALCTKKLAYLKLNEQNYEDFFGAYNLLNKIKGTSEFTNKEQAILGAMNLYGQGTTKNEAQGKDLLTKSKLSEAQFLLAMHSKDNAKLKASACTYPVASGTYGEIAKDNSYLAHALFTDLFFISQLKKNGASTTYDDIYLSAVKACKNTTMDIFYDSKPKFKKPTNEQTTNPEEMYKLGMIYFTGTGVQKNFVKGFTYMQKASDLGFKKAHNNLGIFYLLGIGTSQNGKLAFETLMKGAATGDIKATVNSAAVRNAGVGIAPDLTKSIDQLNRAAGKGSKIANMHLIYVYNYTSRKNDYFAFKSFAKLVSLANDQ